MCLISRDREFQAEGAACENKRCPNDCGEFADNPKPVLVLVPGNKLSPQKNLALAVMPKDNVSGA